MKRNEMSTEDADEKTTGDQVRKEDTVQELAKPENTSRPFTTVRMNSSQVLDAIVKLIGLVQTDPGGVHSIRFPHAQSGRTHPKAITPETRQALARIRELANAVSPQDREAWNTHGAYGNLDFVRLMNPELVLALLDTLD